MYILEIKPSAIKELSKIQLEDALRIDNAIQELVHTPFPTGCKKLKATENKYRIRVGNYRVIYAIDKGRLVILILKIGHRKNIYL